MHDVLTWYQEEVKRKRCWMAAALIELGLLAFIVGVEVLLK
jgi:hypothetical protein